MFPGLKWSDFKSPFCSLFKINPICQVDKYCVSVNYLIFFQKLNKAKKLASSKSGELFASAEEFAALMDDEELDFNAGAIDQVQYLSKFWSPYYQKHLNTGLRISNGGWSCYLLNRYSDFFNGCYHLNPDRVFTC